MSLPAGVPGLGPVLEHLHLVALLLPDQFADHHGLGQILAVVGLSIVVHHQQRLELDGVAGLAVHQLHLDDVAGLHPVLLASRLDDGVHGSSLRTAPSRWSRGGRRAF